MKYQIIAFLIAINYISCTVTLTNVNKGSCANSKYSFTLTGTTTAAFTGADTTVAVTLSSPTSTTPTCTVADATAPAPPTRRLAAGDVTITCEISSALNAATITVSGVKLNGTDATTAGITQITDTITCPASGSGSGSGSGSENKDSSGKLIQLSGLLFLFISFAF